MRRRPCRRCARDPRRGGARPSRRGRSRAREADGRGHRRVRLRACLLRAPRRGDDRGRAPARSLAGDLDPARRPDDARDGAADARPGMHPVELREMVTSPGGTTIAAIRELEIAGVRAAFLNAIQAAMVRSRELASGEDARRRTHAEQQAPTQGPPPLQDPRQRPDPLEAGATRRPLCLWSQTAAALRGKRPREPFTERKLAATVNPGARRPVSALIGGRDEQGLNGGLDRLRGDRDADHRLHRLLPGPDRPVQGRLLRRHARPDSSRSTSPAGAG